MRMVDLIQKKRDGLPLTKEEIHFIINGYTHDEIPDYQMAALAMAVYFQGMNFEETAHLTRAMASSGDMVDLSKISKLIVDKHSTGGVGDKTTLIVGPLVAAMGLPVAKMSGRGLGHTGGTIDKLESIDGFNPLLSVDEFKKHIETHKLSVISPSVQVAPADKKWYALRDVTATVNSIPLVASSIMSKKLAGGAQGIVLDVKVGSGAFLKKQAEARRLAETMVSIGKQLGRKTVALLTDMNEPLGYEVGNANEVREAISVLRGEGEARLTKLCLSIAAHMVVVGGLYEQFEEAYRQAEQALVDGRALAAFKQFVAAQGGDIEQVNHPERLPQSTYQVPIHSDSDGYVTQVDAEGIGIAAMMLGAGRQTTDDVIDHGVGVTLKKKIGDPVRKGELIALLHSNEPQPEACIKRIEESIVIGGKPIKPPLLIYEVID